MSAGLRNRDLAMHYVYTVDTPSCHVYTVDMAHAFTAGTSSRSLTRARYVAVALSVLTVIGLFINDSLRSDNLFLVPDLLVSGMLLVSASLGRSIAAAALLFAFGLSAGVFTTAAFSYVVRGEFGIGVSIFAAVCVGAAATLLRETVASSRM